jgi:ParB-like chromosome segregation protein Spo0J
MSDTLAKALIDEAHGTDDPQALMRWLGEVRTFLSKELSPVAAQPVDNILWVPVDMVQPNDYNPNSVAEKEMRLLYLSILNDGYTQPVVTIWDETIGKYVIVDGFHRYFTCKNNPDIHERNCGLLPIVVIDKPINDRMASTVRHNRARGKHSIDGMASMVFAMLEEGWDDKEICNELGMIPEELARLKHVTGFSKLFQDAQYTAAWETRRQIRVRIEHDKVAHPVRPNSAEAAVRPTEPPAPRKRTRPIA